MHDDTTEVERLRAEVRRLRAELRAAGEENEKLRLLMEAELASAVHFSQQVRDLRGSLSWKVTRPLRRIARLVR